MIPKKAHVIWLGGKEIPKKEYLFIDRNKSVLKDYDFKIWKDEEIKDLISVLVPLLYES